MTFVLACVPPKTTHHAKRIVRIGRFYRLADSAALVMTKEMLDTLLLPHQPAVAVTGPVRLELEFTWPWLSSHSKRVRATGRLRHTSRPDCSNLAKSVEDRLVALRFVEDDNAVCDLRVTKYWGDTPGIAVTLEAFGDND